MTIEEIKKHKTYAEIALCEAVEKMINEFYSKTGYSVSGVNVEMVETTRMGMDRKEFHLGKAELKVAVDL